MAGWVYVMSNSEMEGLVKIGRSSKEPAGDRVRELSRETGVPAPFVVEYQALVENEHREESKLHEHFEVARLGSKEFFRLSVTEAIADIRMLCEIKYEDIFHVSEDEILRRQKASEKLKSEELEAQRKAKNLKEQESKLQEEHQRALRERDEQILRSRRTYVSESGSLVNYLTSEFRDEGLITGLLSLVANLMITLAAGVMILVSVLFMLEDGLSLVMVAVCAGSLWFLWYMYVILRKRSLWEEAERKFPFPDEE